MGPFGSRRAPTTLRGMDALRNRLAAAVAAAAIALTFAACGDDDVDDLRNEAESTADELQEEAESTADELRDDGDRRRRPAQGGRGASRGHRENESPEELRRELEEFEDQAREQGDEIQQEAEELRKELEEQLP